MAPTWAGPGLFNSAVRFRGVFSVSGKRYFVADDLGQIVNALQTVSQYAMPNIINIRCIEWLLGERLGIESIQKIP